MVDWQLAEFVPEALCLVALTPSLVPGGVSIVLSSLEPAASRHAGVGPAGGAASKPGLPQRQPSRYGA
ncbi:hypothetical protein, partial [uncultured Enorma sp.]|uniref:hypothetical protein n=1 Tax=uncultured Enorma sp. TaxID=1714346 RepID=UPI0026046B20